jgi:hypothetical protein
MTNTQIFSALITDPRRAFAELETSPRFALPMVLMVAATLGLIVWFYSTINVDVFINHTLMASGLTAAQRAQTAAFRTRGFLMGSALIGGTLSIFVIQVVEAFYFFFIFEFLDVSRSFRQWFAFSWWCSLPGLISLVAAAAMLVFGHSPDSIGVLSPFSLNQIFYHLDAGDTGYSLLNSITLVQPLTILLTIIGAHTWSKRSWVVCSAVVILPQLLIYGIWTWFVFFR